MDLSLASTITLNNGTEMPRMGIGVYQVPDGEPTQHAVTAALAAGYRHVDTAKLYRNEVSVGRAIRDSGVPREDVWVTTKLWPSDLFHVVAACDASLARLGLEYVDLYLVHFPLPGFVSSIWRQMETVATSGRARAVGVSNHRVGHLARLATADVPPAVNQVRASVFGYRHDVYNRCRAQHVVFEAYSPLRRGRVDDPIVAEVAAAHGKSAAQVLLRWALQKDMVVIPKSSHEERIKENADVYDFALDDAEMQRLDGLSR